MNAVTDNFPNGSEVADTPVSMQLPLLTGRLEVVSGVQQGASARIQQSTPITVGNNAGDDIVLRDEAIQHKHLKVTLDVQTISIECLHEGVLVDGIALPKGENIQAAGSVLVQIGAVAMIISAPAASADAGSREPFNTSAPFAADAEEAVADTLSFKKNVDEVSDAASPGKDQSVDTTRGFASGSRPGVFTLAMLLLGAVIVWQSGLFQAPQEEPVFLADLMGTSPFEGLDVVQNGNVATVSGFVNTFSESAELDAWLDQTGLLIDNNVLVGAALSEQVADVFRVNGITAEVEVEKGGIVTVTTMEGDIDHLASVEERVMSDVPRVTELQIRNTPPVIESADENDYGSDPGKRVAMVVSDALAYVVTEDQSRYFIGSILPSGHRITDIKEGKVTLEKQGVVTTLEF
ncbi:MAG: FHA domain-containing protein [Granulosicoccus sp.]